MCFWVVDVASVTGCTIGTVAIAKLLRGFSIGYGERYTRPVLQELVADAPSAYRAEKKLAIAREKAVEKGLPSRIVDMGLADQMREANISRRKIIEEKARANLSALAISASFSTAGLTFASSHSRLASLLLFPLASFGLGAYASVQALQVGQVFTLTVQEEKRRDAATRKVWYAELNDFANSAKANWLYVSYKALRNAIILLVVSVGISVLFLLN